MKKVLLLNSSLHGVSGNSTKLAAQFIAQWQRIETISVSENNLAELNLPHLSAAEMQAWAVPKEQQSQQQQALGQHSERLLAEVNHAEAIVIGLPMYNFGVPSTFKAWIDRIARAGRTFSYTPEGPKGLLTGKTVYVLAARGGMYQGTVKDTQSQYLLDVFALMGISDVQFIYLEGVNMGEAATADAWQGARQAIEQILPRKVA